jgi:hypothetical protein
MTNPFLLHPAYGGGFAGMRDLALWDARQGAFSYLDETGVKRQVPAAGCRMLFDIGAYFDGAIAFQPKVMEVRVPRGSPPPDLPPGTEGWDWQPASWVQVLFATSGLRRLRITGKIFLNWAEALWLLLRHYPEVQNGQIPELLFAVPENVPTDFGVFMKPDARPDSFFDRDPDIFGPRIVPPPPPRIGGAGGAPVALPLSTDADAAPEPVKPTAADTRLSHALSRARAAEAEKQADPMARYRPADPKKAR